MHELCNTLTKKGDRIGSRPIKSITPLGADKIYDKLTVGAKGQRLRTAEKIVLLCRKAWRVVHRLHPDQFNKDVPNPWPGVTMKRRVKLVKSSATREQVYTFAHGCIERNEPECAAVAVICFEWLQRPEDVIAGHIKWTGCRTGPKPTIRVEHHKTGVVIDHPSRRRGCRVLLGRGAVLSPAPTSRHPYDPAGTRGWKFQTIFVLGDAKDCATDAQGNRAARRVHA